MNSSEMIFIAELMNMCPSVEKLLGEHSRGRRAGCDEMCKPIQILQRQLSLMKELFLLVSLVGLFYLLILQERQANLIAIMLIHGA
jgi:hypothetical protein